MQFWLRTVDSEDKLGKGGDEAQESGEFAFDLSCIFFLTIKNKRAAWSDYEFISNHFYLNFAAVNK